MRRLLSESAATATVSANLWRPYPTLSRESGKGLRGPMFELYDFTFSHYSEKARWALDFKGVPYTPRHLLPGFHMRTTRKLAPRSSVPILKTDTAVIQGSTEIIDFLDQTFPERSLTPPDPHDANSALEWEKYLDVEIGVTLRLWFYYHTLPDRERALRFLCSDAAWLQRS